MKKIYDVNQLLKPVRLYEQDSDATEAEDAKEENDADKNDDSEKKDENDQKNDGENKNDEQTSDKQSEQKAENGNTDTQEQNQTEQNQNNKGNVQAQQNALNGISKSLMDCSVELDNIYKNNNLKKYGMGVENAYKGLMRFIWPAIGITVAITVAYLCMSGIIPAKKVLSKVPLIGKLFQGDKAAINSVQQSLLFAGTNKATQMGTQAINNIGNKPQQAQPVGNSTVAPETATQPATEPQGEQSAQANTENVNSQDGASSTTAPAGSNPEQKTDKAPTIENSVEAQAQAKPGDVIQRNNGEKYVLNQGDIDWAKQQVQKGKSKETVDQAKQEEDTGATTAQTNVQNETAPDANQQNTNGQTTTPTNGNAQQNDASNQNANGATPQANTQPEDNSQANTNQQTNNQQGESIKDVAQQVADKDNSQKQQTPQENNNQSQSIKQAAQEVQNAAANVEQNNQQANANQQGESKDVAQQTANTATQSTNNAPTSNSTTVKNPDGSTTTTTQNNNGQGSTGTTTTTTNGNTTTTTNVETQVGGHSATHGTPVTQAEAQTILKNNGLQTNNEKLNEGLIGAIVDNGLDKQEAIKVLSDASASINKIKMGKSSIDTEKIFFRDGADGNSPNMSQAFNQILLKMAYAAGLTGF